VLVVALECCSVGNIAVSAPMVSIDMRDLDDSAGSVGTHAQDEFMAGHGQQPHNSESRGRGVEQPKRTASGMVSECAHGVKIRLCPPEIV
jgi:hypothetical protein